MRFSGQSFFLMHSANFFFHMPTTASKVSHYQGLLPLKAAGTSLMRFSAGGHVTRQTKKI